MKAKFILAVMTGLFFILSISTDGRTADDTRNDEKDDVPEIFFPGTLSSENFPCSKCHRFRPIDRKQRDLKLAHAGIVLKHAEKQRWCLDCHDGDKLRLPNGELIDYDKPYLLCGQCHGTVFRDWKAGIHGKTTGMWNGVKVYRICVNCHDPHQPKFKQIAPEKQPLRPTEIKLNLR